MPAFSKVLFIDDDSMTVNIYERLLKHMHFTGEFVSKGDGEQAKEYLISNKSALPDIIFVDLYMTVMSGTEFLDWFKDWCKLEDINVPVYVLSSSLSKEDFEQVCAFNIAGYIVKPITAQHLNEISAKYSV